MSVNPRTLPRSIHRLCLRVHTRLCLLLTSCMRTCASEDSAFGFDAGPEPNGVGPGYRFPVSGCTHKDVNANVSQISAFKFFEESPLAFSGTTYFSIANQTRHPAGQPRFAIETRLLQIEFILIVHQFTVACCLPVCLCCLVGSRLVIKQSPCRRCAFCVADRGLDEYSLSTTLGLGCAQPQVLH